MPRVYLQRASSGYLVVRGEIVRNLQLKLQDAGHDPGVVDGIFGSDTETAIKSFQLSKGLHVNGKLTDETWAELMQLPSPPVFDRCLQLTADFEGHGFQTIAGNFDGAGLTWGIIGYTLQHGEIQNILRRRPDCGGKIEKAYSLGILKNKLAHGVSQTEEEHAYARRYTIFGSKGRSFWTGSVE